MNILSDSHLDDPRWDRELQDEQAALDRRHDAVLKRKREILSDVSEMEQLITEYPSTFAQLIRPLMGEHYQDYVPDLRMVVMRLAEGVADQDTMTLDAFRNEKEIER